MIIDVCVTSSMSETVDKKLSELTGKIKALNLAIKV